jgi:RNA polymerase sigma-70 factor (ECF subfamily)
MARETATSRTKDFDRYRPLLFSIAYRMLGSVMDAEDVVQEAFVRWQGAPEGEVRSPRAYLSTVVTRLSIDQLRSAQVRREEYVGPWLPEPLAGQLPVTTSRTRPFWMSPSRWPSWCCWRA